MTGPPSSRDHCPTSARWPTSSSAACSTPSTTGRSNTGSTPRPIRPSGSRRPTSRSLRPSCSRFGTGDIKTIIWATGYRPEYPWLHIPVLDAKGGVRHVGGVTPVPGLYVMGTTFLRRRKSTLIVGAGDDAARPQHPPLRVLGSAGEGHMTSHRGRRRLVMRSR